MGNMIKRTKASIRAAYRLGRHGKPWKAVPMEYTARADGAPAKRTKAAAESAAQRSV